MAKTQQKSPKDGHKQKEDKQSQQSSKGSEKIISGEAVPAIVEEILGRKRQRTFNEEKFKRSNKNWRYFNA